MEENNRKGPGIFYAVVGVATLVVAIIGATFAYFSASTTAGAGTIEGETLETAGSLTVDVARVAFAQPDSGDNLVPAYFGAAKTPGNITTTEVQNMLKAKCVNAGFTGCHLYKIDVESDTTVQNANIQLTLNTSGVTDTAAWGYSVFQVATGTLTAADGLSSTGTIAFATAPADQVLTGGGSTPTVGAISTGVTLLDFHNYSSLTKDTPVTYYLLVYIVDDDAVQNEEGANNATGSYAGAITAQTAGGKVRATFSAA